MKGFWVKMPACAVFGTAVSLFLYFGLSFSLVANAVIGLIFGILSGCSLFDFKGTVKCLIIGFNSSKSFIAEFWAEDTESKKEAPQSLYSTELPKIFTAPFSEIARILTSALKAIFSRGFIFFAIGFSYRLAIGFFAFWYFWQRTHEGGLPVSTAIDHVYLWVAYVVFIYILASLMDLIFGVSNNGAMMSSVVSDYHYDGFSRTDIERHASSLQMIVGVIVVSLLLSVAVFCFVLTICLTPFWAMVEIKKKSKLWLVATGVICGSVAGWCCHGLGVDKAVIVGVFASFAWVGLPFLINLFLSEIKPWSPFRVFELMNKTA